MIRLCLSSTLDVSLYQGASMKSAFIRNLRKSTKELS